MAEFTPAPCIPDDGIEARIPGTPISILTLVEAHNRLKIASEELAASLHLSLAQLFAALAYYHANQALFDAELARRREETEKALAELFAKQGARNPWPELTGQAFQDETDDEIREALERLS